MADPSILACPACRSPLAEEEGCLACRRCNKKFSVRKGVLDFSELPATPETRRTVDQFGKSWKIFDHVEPYHEAQFLEWISPLGKDDFRGSEVFEAGCGKGRHTVIVSSFGPRRLVSADLSEAVFIAAEKTKGDPGVSLLRTDLKKLPVADEAFDVVFCVGVLHHLDRPSEGLNELWRILKPGGKLLLWVYAREGNGWIVRFLDPVRKAVTSKIPARILRILAFPLTALLFILLKTLYGPLGSWGRRESFLPYSSYLGSISPFPFREIDNIVVDHLCPGVAYYLSRADLENMFRPLGPSSLQFRWHHKNSWTVLASKS